MSHKHRSLVFAAALTWLSTPAVSQGLDDASQRARLAQACGNELSISEAGCVCLAGRAMDELSELQRDYLLATAIAPSAAERMRKDVSQDDIRVLATFLATAERECEAAR